MEVLKSSYPKGSEWRRWDLHVHTPASQLGSSFPGISWPQYIDELDAAAVKSQIAVIGITDYMSIEGYEKVYACHVDQKDRRLKSISLIPNIEFRAQPETRDGKALNIHLLIDPTPADHIAQIKRALANLKVIYGKKPFSCTKEQLIEFGKAQNASLADEAAYKLGIEQFKPSYQTIMEWYESEPWLKEHSIVGISNGKDGISGLPLDGFSATRDDLLKSSHFVFSGNPKDRVHYLGEKKGFPPEKIIELYNSLKPCLHGSDAHELTKLFVPDEDRYCWIKADPTFEGLRQVLWEPASRVIIGATKPQLADSGRVIRAIEISNAAGWFTQSQIELNNGLITIIGEKGSGKTAIADLISFAAGVPMNTSSLASFITKGKIHLAGTTVRLHWLSGTVTTGVLTDKPFVTQRPLVRYLSQDFVERLCSDDHQGTELQDAIEEVVFSYLGETHKEGYSSFAELRKAREAASQTKRQQIQGQLTTLNREIERLHSAIGQKDAKEALKKQAEEQLNTLKEQLPSIQSQADQTILQQLEVEKAKKDTLEKDLATLQRRRRALESFLKSYVDFKENIAQQLSDLHDSMPASVPEEVRKKIFPVWDPTVENDIGSMIAIADAEITKIKGSEVSPQTDGVSLTDVNARIKQHQESLSKDEVNRKVLLELQKQISQQETAISRIAKELEDLSGKTLRELKQKEREREQTYQKFFVALAEDEQGLKELYAPMKEGLEKLDAAIKFELSAGYRIDSASWLAKSDRFYDGRKPAALSKKDEIEKFVTTELNIAWKSGDAELLAKKFEEFKQLLSPENFAEFLTSPSTKLVDIYDWMYSTDHIGTTYKIKYGGTDLEYLSPGTRGIALLVLYLLMDEDDRRPLVIDQPEGNLDNSSIYAQLVPYIRKAKDNRQIILVTHNPNLVVATDAEQIVIASAERKGGQPYPEISYVSGSLEHSVNGLPGGTRQAVCTLLEGGERAFKEREGRYSIKRH